MTAWHGQQSPRSGVDARVTEALGAAGPPRLIYVSCDPATLARDIGRLSSAYEIVHVRAFDLFPQTAHVEAVVVLERTAAELGNGPAAELGNGPATQPGNGSDAQSGNGSAAEPGNGSAGQPGSE